MQNFVAVVQEGSYTAAGRYLGKTKAIVSRQVNQLESVLNSKLINRSTRSFSITDEGHAVYEQCLFIINQVERLESLNKGDDCLTGRIRICAPQTYTEQVLMRCFCQFKALHPNLHMDIQVSDQFVDIVEQGFDLGIRIGQLADSNLIARQLARVKPLLVASPEFIAHHSPILSIEQIASLPCISDSNRRTGTTWHYIDNGQQKSLKIKASIRVNSAHAAAQAAMLGSGVALLPDFAVQAALNKGDL
ncbi:LysR family transcriptional regulator [Saccharobesus litoralis]|uniref:LysR family transcriptional regulator n=2 Tax=Saccharobesus litoralis TaxID=2172099 RepID=A0A2S0VNA2_9ALTE|nr:LysR family transcriptional regulator [Saccharobesus litoralis]